MDVPLTFHDGRYVYKPQETKEFVPESFSFTALVQRSSAMRSDRNYNFRIGVYPQADAQAFAQNLMSICGDAPYRGIAPANIFVNGGSMNAGDMITNRLDELDFLFVQGYDTSFLRNQKGEIPYQDIFDSHTNLWLTLRDEGCGRCFNRFKEKEAVHVTGLQYLHGKFQWKEQGRKMAFNLQNCRFYPKQGVSIRNLEREKFRYLLEPEKEAPTPVFILERENGSYIVVSHENIFEHLDVFAPFVYDVLENIYMRSYVRTFPKNMWITDEPVDYIGSLNTPLHRTHMPVNLDDMVFARDGSIDTYTLCRVDIDKPDIVFERRAPNGEMFFRKIAANDPEKQMGETSIFTFKESVLVYREPRHKLVESGVQIRTGMSDNRCYVSVLPFASSKHCLLSTKTSTFEIEQVDKEYVIYALPVSKAGQESMVQLIAADDTDVDLTAGSVLARVHVAFEGVPIAYDIRRLGGGLPEGYTDYDMMDIGNRNGRPYRMGTGAVIRLPKAYEKYADRIQAAVDAYKVAADKLYIIYE